MAEQMEPEAVGSLLNEYFTQMSDLVYKYDGMVDKYIGDAVMALFGIPFSHSDDSDMAVLCALEMQERFKKLCRKWLKDGRPTKFIGLGIGIHKGRVVVGNFGSRKKMSYTAIGDPVNVASRLENIAKKGEVVVSKELLSALKIPIKAEMLNIRIIRGKTGTYEIYGLTASNR